MTNEEIRTEGLRVLLEALGPEGMIRFIQQFAPGSGDYTRDRKKMFIGETIDSLSKKIEKMVENRKS